MKRFALAIVCSLIATALAARADYILVQKMESPMQNGDITIKMKGSTMRMDTETASMIMDLDSGDMTNIMHAQKMVMKMSGAQTKQMAEAAMAAQPKGEEPKLVATGKKEVINDLNTEEYTTDLMGTKMSIWVAKDYPGFKQSLAAMEKMDKPAMSAMAQGRSIKASQYPGMPIRTVMEAGGSKFTTTLVTAKETTFSADEIQKIPEGYQSMEMPTMPPAAAPAAK